MCLQAEPAKNRRFPAPSGTCYETRVGSGHLVKPWARFCEDLYQQAIICHVLSRKKLKRGHECGRMFSTVLTGSRERNLELRAYLLWTAQGNIGIRLQH